MQPLRTVECLVWHLLVVLWINEGRAPRLAVCDQPPLSKPVTMDLAKVDPSTGKPIRTIIKTTDPQKYGIQVSDYLT